MKLNAIRLQDKTGKGKFADCKTDLPSVLSFLNVGLVWFGSIFG